MSHVKCKDGWPSREERKGGNSGTYPKVPCLCPDCAHCPNWTQAFCIVCGNCKGGHHGVNDGSAPVTHTQRERERAAGLRPKAEPRRQSSPQAIHLHRPPRSHQIPATPPGFTVRPPLTDLPQPPITRSQTELAEPTFEKRERCPDCTAVMLRLPGGARVEGQVVWSCPWSSTLHVRVVADTPAFVTLACNWPAKERRS